MSPSLALFILVVLVVVGWFAVGTHYNVRKGHQFMRWLQDGLPLLGEKTTLRWLGSSVLELKVQQAKPPFRQAEILVLFEPRDVAPLWALARLRGRRDLFIFRAILRRHPSLHLEALDTGAWPHHSFSDRVKKEQWPSLSTPAPLVAAAPSDTPGASALVAEASLEGCPVQFLLVRDQEPNFELHWHLNALCKNSARQVLETLQRLASRL